MNSLSYLIILAINIALIFALKSDVYYCRMRSIDFYPNDRQDSRRVGWLDKGDYIYALGKTSNRFIEFYGGYVQDNALSKADQKKKPNCRTTAELNFRTGPGTYYPVIETLPEGTKIVLYDQEWSNKSWGVTDHGYCHLNYVAC